MTLDEAARLIVRSCATEHRLAVVERLETIWPDRVVIAIESRNGDEFRLHLFEHT